MNIHQKLILGFADIFKNKTERRNSEELLRESEEKFERIAATVKDAIILMDNDGKIKYWNEAAKNIFGYSQKEVINEEIHLILSPEKYHNSYREGFARFRTTGEGKAIGKTLELDAKRKDGTLFPIELSLSALKLKGKWHSIGILRDISERRQAEEALQKAYREVEQKVKERTAELHASNEAMRTLESAVEQTADMVIVTSRDGIIEYVNPAFEKITGYDKKEIIGKKPKIFKSGRQDKKFYEKLWGTILAGETFRATLKNEKKNGVLFDVEKTITPIKNETGEITHFVSIDKDITERKKIEKIRIEKERLEYASRAKSDFIANMSHELRTPLNAVLGFSQLLKTGTAGELNEKQKHYTNNIIISGDFLLKLINDILDLSKIEAGKIELVKENISVPQSIEEAMNLIKEEAFKHNIVINKEFDPELDTIEADKQRLKQILFNLLSNAVKFSKPGGGVVTIITRKVDDEAEISVSDTGIGITEENLGKLFKEFEQVNADITRDYGGTGLGLAISRKLVELHDGRIWAESRYGEGSTFIFTLPLKSKGET